MNRIEKVEAEVEAMSTEELSAFREWFARFDGDQWDRQFEADAVSGKLDGMAATALREYEDGKSTEL